MQGDARGQGSTSRRAEQESHIMGTTHQVDQTTGQESGHAFEEHLETEKVTHCLRSLAVPDLTAKVEARSPGAIQYVRDLAEAKRLLLFREGKRTGRFAVPKPGSTSAKAAKVKEPVPIICPDCEGWGEMENAATGKRERCPRCHGQRWILRP